MSACALVLISKRSESSFDIDDQNPFSVQYKSLYSHFKAVSVFCKGIMIQCTIFFIIWFYAFLLSSISNGHNFHRHLSDFSTLRIFQQIALEIYQSFTFILLNDVLNYHTDFNVQKTLQDVLWTVPAPRTVRLSESVTKKGWNHKWCIAVREWWSKMPF